MSYFVIEFDAVTGSVSVPVPRVFESREVALEELAGAIAAGLVSVRGQVMVVDLTSGVPVLMMPGVTAAPPASVEPEPLEGSERQLETEPEAAEAAETPAVPEPEPMDESTADAVYSIPGAADVDESGPDFDEPSAEGSVVLADALRRAATSLEEEGVIAPESIGGEADEAVPAAIDWPWETVAAEAPSGLADDDRLITSGPLDGGEAYMPKPVIMGDYANVLPIVEPASADDDEPFSTIHESPLEEAAQADDEPVSAIAEAAAALGALGASAGSSTGPAEPMSALHDPFGEHTTVLDLEEPSEMAQPDEAAVPEPSDTVSSIAGESILDAGEETGYEASGGVDLATYTCNDCVYANTCPKVGQAAPADCGSFQWRAD